MYDFYEAFYRVAQTSRAYAELCERAYGRDFGQHGFANMAQLDFLIEAAGLTSESRVLELGCGNGGMAGYIAAQTSAHVTGVDYSPEAIRQANARAAAAPDRLAFQVADMNALSFAPGSFDAIISIDTLYFASDGLNRLVGQLGRLLAPGGSFLIFYSHAADPMTPIAVFPRETLPPDRTPVAGALREQGFVYRVWDFTEADHQHARRMEAALEVLLPAFEKEGALFLYENRMGEARGVQAAHEAGAAARYLYLAHRVDGDCL
jgi:cyclopropane fatty-acyl-phospholipid synthase-like methyltransferase